MKPLFFCLLCHLIYDTTIAQNTNLVPNPSFEQLKTLAPSKFSANVIDFDSTIQDWQSASLATPDILTSHLNDLSRSYKIPIARTGKNSVGIINNMGVWTEYIQVRLKQPLEKGKTYYAEFWYMALIGKNHPMPQKNPRFGCWFHDGAIQQTQRYIDEQPQVAPPQKKACRPHSWQKLAGTFVATEAHTHLCIGQFHTEYKSAMDGCIAIDDVIVCEAKDLPIEPPTPLPIKMEVGTTIVLDNIIFKSGTAILEQESFPNLDLLLQNLLEHPNICIAIHGHTDNVGSQEANLELSTNRAQTIYHYLIQEGIDKKRLKFAGFGETKPVASNENESGRKKNRRVEFLIQDL